MSDDAKDGDDDASKPFGLAERKQVQAEVVHVLLETTQRVDAPTAVFTAGQPGAGKTRSIVEPVQAEFDGRGGIAVVDPDAIRPLLPSAKAEMAKGGSEFSDAAYRAAGTIAFDVSMDMISHRRNVLRDGTLSDLTYPRQEFDRMRASEFRIEVHVAAVSQDLSWARTVLRQQREAELSETGFGRGVGREFHDKAAAGIVSSTRSLWNEKLVDRMVVYDSQGNRIMDTTQDKGGQWQQAGKAHSGPTPDAIVAERQTKPQGQDLVAAANTWLDVRDLVTASDRKHAAPEATIADIERQTGKALDAVANDKAAKGLAVSDDRLQAALDVHAKEPHRGAAQAWLRNPAEARQNWPEHSAAFDSAMATVNQVQRVAHEVGQKNIPDPREFMAGKLAKGEVTARPDPVRKVDAPERKAPEREQPARRPREQGERDR